jgi:DNA-binding MarR family transcriptional regulator
MKTNPTPNAYDFRERAPLGYLVHEVARLLKRRFEDEARGHGITLPQWRALTMIAKNDCISQVSLAAMIDADPMTMSGILDRLEKRGLVTREADPADSRAKLARLTDEGQVLFSVARSVGQAMYVSALEGVSPDERQTVESVLEKIRANLARQSAEPEVVAK